MTGPFSGTAAFLAGGSSDLALALAPLLIGQSIRPCLSFRDTAGLEKINAHLKGYDGLFDTSRLDLSDPSSRDTAFGPVSGALHYLVDFIQGDFEDLVSSANETNSSDYFSENVSARAAMLKTATRIMIRGAMGRLVFVSSAAAGRPGRGQGFYAAAKLASEALYRNIGLELGKFGITAVSLRPGFIDAGRGRAFLTKHTAGSKNVAKPVHILKPEDVALTLMFLLSDPARGFNATELLMDGGASSGKTYE
jgi:3-oxoacyl-[acyl-carrier protein] reductase